MKIAFLGLGRMGSELATHLAASPHNLSVWNRSPAATERFAEAARIAATTQDAVTGAKVVVTSLFGPDAVRDVILSPDLPITPGALWIDTTTNSPADADGFAAWARARDIDYVHSPVIGSLDPARAGMLGVLLGGEPAAADRAAAVVSLWADPDRTLRYDTAGQAAAGKLVANLTVAIAMQGLVEALRLGRAGGLTREQTLALTGLPKTPFAGITALKADMIRHGNYNDTQFSIDLLTKDIGLMLSVGAAPLPALTASYTALEGARRSGHGDDDFAAIALEDGAL